eukprot:TRINITY_DN5495_c1_g1_i2.p2 TRINITY_DN5495_c1_g1~~TRINITY_DN5495_c1_g1_i2.p2  ORF type:complete len:343 (-),score=79.60 TRINITY_DN5495_c1_g1_i2:503-1471(-)
MPGAIMQYTYPLPWETVVRAYLSRYPVHPKIPLMLAQDISAIDWHSDKGEVKVERRMKADIDAPYWIKRVFGVYWLYMWQTHSISLHERRMVSIARSNPSSTLFKAGEVATWEQHPDNENWTLFTVVAQVQLLPDWAFFSRFQSIIEGLVLRTYTGQFQLARKIDWEFIEQLYKKEAEEGNKAYSLVVPTSIPYFEPIRFPNNNPTLADIAPLSRSCAFTYVPPVCPDGNVATPPIAPAVLADSAEAPAQLTAKQQQQPCPASEKRQEEEAREREARLAPVVTMIDTWLRRSLERQRFDGTFDLGSTFHLDVPLSPCEGKIL